jgi:hypothetical protein
MCFIPDFRPQIPEIKLRISTQREKINGAPNEKMERRP